MAGAPREYVMVVQESAYLTPVVSPVVWTTATTYGLANASAYYVRLGGPNRFTMRPRPVGTVTTPMGGGFDVPAYMFADKEECKGQLTLELTVGQAPMWLSWALQRMTGGTSPWTSTVATGDLASCSVYHAITRSDNTVKRQVYLGTKVDSFALTISEGSTACQLVLGLTASLAQGNQFDASSDPSAGTFPSPADADLPIDPFTFTHAGGTSFITYAGAVRTQFTELNITVANTLARRFFAQRHIQVLTLCGRKTTVASKLWYPATGQDDRTAYSGLVSKSMSIEINNGTHGFTIGANAQNVLSPFEDDLPLNDLYMQSSTENNLWDPTAGSDFTLTIT
jgi:tail tube protein